MNFLRLTVWSALLMIVIENSHGGPLDTSTVRNRSPTNNPFLTGMAVNARGSSIAYGDGRFVALSSSGSIVSFDGVNWVNHQTGKDDELLSVARGNGQFIAVEGSNMGGTCLSGRD